jgi:HTH-type transcriptional regulator, competence development regulator
MEVQMSKKLGNLLRSARDLKDVSLREVEKRIKVSNAYLSQIESGSIAEPSPHILRKLADYYDLNYMELMAAAGYVSKQTPSSSSVGSMLLAAQNFSEDEASAAVAFIKQYRDMTNKK